MKKKIRTIGIISLLVFGGFTNLLNFESKNAQAIWEIETVDDSTWISSPSIALDTSGYAHISYSDMTNSDLKYAKWTGTEWNIENVDSAGNVGGFSSIALDSNNFAHIGYSDWTNDCIKYAKWTGSGWSLETIDYLGYLTGDISLDLDGNDHAHMSYREGANSTLKYARWTGSTWINETLDVLNAPRTTKGGWTTSLAVDSNGFAHISYHYGIGNDLKYARWNGTGWNIQIVEDGGPTTYYGSLGVYNSIAVDSNDYAHISYYDSWPRTDLKYAKWNGSHWNIEIVDGDGGSKSSIALDSSGHAHISYLDESQSNLKYTQWNGSSWRIRIVESHLGNIDSSLAVDSNGYAHIGYEKLLNLTYAKFYIEAPSSPQNLQAIPGDSYVLLTWEPPTFDGDSPITNYRIYRGTTDDEETFLTETGDVLFYNDTTVSNGVTYYYKVTAVNSMGESPQSNETIAVPIAETTSSIDNDNWLWLLIGIIIAVIIVILILLVWRMKREPTQHLQQPPSP